MWLPAADSTNARVALPHPLYTSQHMLLCPGLNSRNLPPTTGAHNPCLCKRAAAFSMSNHSWGTDSKSAPNMIANAGKSSRAFSLQDGTDGLCRPFLLPVARLLATSPLLPPCSPVLVMSTCVLPMANVAPPMLGKKLYPPSLNSEVLLGGCGIAVSWAVPPLLLPSSLLPPMAGNTRVLLEASNCRQWLARSWHHHPTQRRLRYLPTVAVVLQFVDLDVGHVHHCPPDRPHVSACRR